MWNQVERRREKSKRELKEKMSFLHSRHIDRQGRGRRRKKREKRRNFVYHIFKVGFFCLLLTLYFLT